MNDTKDSFQLPTEESVQAEMPYQLMSYNLPCILRRRDVVSNEVDYSSAVNTTDIDWGLERKFEWEPDDGKPRGILQVLRQVLAKPLELLTRKLPDC